MPNTSLAPPLLKTPRFTESESAEINTTNAEINTTNQKSVQDDNIGTPIIISKENVIPLEPQLSHNSSLETSQTQETEPGVVANDESTPMVLFSCCF